MRGPRIIVFHIRQLLKTAAFVLAGVVIILLLIWVLAPNDSGRVQRDLGVTRVGGSLTFTADEAFGRVLFVPGQYRSVIVLDDSHVYITVTVDAFSITDVSMSNLAYAQQRLFPLFEPVMEVIRHDILTYQTTRIEPPENGPVTGQIILEAVNIALNQAFAHVLHSPGL